MLVKISLSFFAVIKLCYTKLLSNQALTLVPKLTLLLRESNIVQLSSWGLVWDLQDKVRPLRALSSMLSQDTRFLLYLTNSMVCLCEWMTRPARSKWWALLCGFAVPRNDWRQPPKVEPCWGFLPTCQCEETPNLPEREMGEVCVLNFPFLGQLFLVSLTTS